MAAVAGIQWLWVTLIGLGVGTISGGLGIGAGVVLIPALVFALAADQKTAQGIALVVIIPMVVMSAIRYALNPAVRIDWWVVLVLGAAGVIGANIGSTLAFALPADMLKKSFAVFIIVAGVVMLWK